MGTTSPLVEDFPPTRRPFDTTSITIPPEKLGTFFDTGWASTPHLRCKSCGAPGYQEQAGERRIGCKLCGYITHYPAQHFEPATLP